MPKVIALTAHAVTGDRERYIDLGFDDYVAKPVRKAVLIDAICQVLLGPAKSVASPAKAAAPDVPGELIDEDVFDEFLMDRGAERATDLLVAIASELDRKRVVLKTHIGRAADRESLAREFHNLASIVATVGARELASSARAYEHGCGEGELPDERQMSTFLDDLECLGEECRRRAEKLTVSFA
jgi:CheY-like chemotaxis protein